MWSFFKKKDTSASSAKAAGRNDLTFEEFSDLIRMEFAGRKAYLFYAQLCGYLGESVLADTESFFQKVHSEPDQITEQGIEFAVSKLLKDLDGTASKWDVIYRKYYKSSLSDSEMLRRENYVSRWPKAGLASLVATFESDCKAYIVEYALSLRNIDLGNVKYKIEDKWVYFRPILSKALRDGVDRYGEQSYSLFFDECREFVDRFFPDEELKFYEQSYFWVPVYKIALGMLFEEPEEPQEIPDDGVDFEYWCAGQLELQGWDAMVTKGSGDQGVDIVAQKDGIVVAVQCKRYTGTIGNKAVQEVFAGRANILADHACIIGTGGFTKSAVELANATDVRLMDASDIAYFDEYYA